MTTTEKPMVMASVDDGHGNKVMKMVPIDSPDAPKPKGKSKKKKTPPDPIRANPDVTDDRLRLLIERIERLEEEEDGIRQDKRDVYAEAKAVGYDSKIMRQIVKVRKMSPDARAEEEMIFETYKCALGIE